MNRAVFLDRDGVVNKVVVKNGKPHPPAKVEDMVFPLETLSTIQSLRLSGYLVIIITNQPDVSKGVQSRETVEAMHDVIRRRFPVNDIKVCYHVDEDNCSCRKPKPGMILDAAEEYHINLNHSFMIGDRWRDIEAGKAAGCKTVLIQSDVVYDERQAQGMDATVRSLDEAATFILSLSDEKGRDNAQS